MSNESVRTTAVARKTRMQRLRWPLMSLAGVAVIGAAAYFYITGGRYQSTDDAYAQAATVSISANIGGRVIEVEVRDNELVHRGATLFKLDDAPFRIAVNDAAAHLADTRLQIESLKSTYRQRQVELRAARDTQAYAQQQYDRQTRLLASGIASQAQFDQATHALDAARQQVANVQQQIGVALANLGGDPNIAPERHPLVAQAQAALDRAQLNLSYTVISAPTDGVVAKVEQLQVGDTIAASAPVFALVSTRDVWIEANFKEVQLARMRPGQTATVKIDRYPGRQFAATVASLSPSTGSQFSLLPPENATGNWVKVVQRVPVRLQLTEVDAGFRLQGGLSADVTVDTQSRTPELADATDAGYPGRASP
ncbi:MAG TPA: HlyD family secretion protein [Steroidobacteraceae bacterium]|jgi:membrane fusion protein (multidrug efflux system)|nr:HlyD family secretion protein [Steroidobacteraceae bacterium]